MAKTYDFDNKHSQIYKETCEVCGTEIQLSTQKDNHPEYYTDVWVKCSMCGCGLHFELPVN